jgi:hypothetical protein
MFHVANSGRAPSEGREPERAEALPNRQAFDRLLQVSFGMIPSAYLFNSFPLDLELRTDRTFSVNGLLR